MKLDRENSERCALILAGGEGRRLSGLTRRITGAAAPKQFCPVVGAAMQLPRRGCLWNSFVMVSRVSTLIGLFIIALPELHTAFKQIYGALMTPSEQRSIERLHTRIDSTNFSDEVLAMNPFNLAVLPARGFQWSDLGEPARVREVWARRGIQPRWIAA